MDVAWIIFLFAIGACAGSFLNVVIYRLPRGQSIVFPPSHCPNCGRSIRWYDNIPLLSWFLLRARCRSCKAPISPQYILVESATALMVAGLYICYYLLDLRDEAGRFGDSWPTFLAHAALLCSLFVCSVVDIEQWIVPLEVCWFVSLVGIACSAAAPHPWVPKVSLATGAMSVAALIGLAGALVAAHYGLIQRSFVDAEDKPAPAPPSRKKPGKRKATDRKARPIAVAVTAAHGVNPRKEVLRELLYLAPAIVLAAAAWFLVTRVPACARWWSALVENPTLGRHVNGLLGALFGYLIGGAWIWGTRILGTLGFGKEAMGLGDVHLLAAVGAVTGWIVPSIAFFVAPLFGLGWALYLFLRRNQRELPYGPWLAVGTLVVLLFYDAFAAFLKPYAETMEVLLN